MQVDNDAAGSSRIKAAEMLTPKKCKVAEKMTPGQDDAETSPQPPKRRPPPVRGTKRNKTTCENCTKNRFECWRQGGPYPRGSCFECAKAKHKCNITEEVADEIKEEKRKEKSGKRKVKSEFVARGSGLDTEERML